MTNPQQNEIGCGKSFKKGSPLPLLLCLLLAACAPAYGYGAPPSDPYVQRAAADGAIQATEAARIRQAADATLDAAVELGQTEHERARLMLPIQASETALALRATEGLLTAVAAQATATAGAQQATATIQADRERATQAAIQIQATRLANDLYWEVQRESFYAVFWPAVVAVAVIGLLFILAVVLWHGSARLLKIIEDRSRIRQMKRGEIMRLSPGGYWEIVVLNPHNLSQFMSQARPIPSGEGDPARALTRSGSVWASPVDRPESNAERALRLVQDAEVVNGANSNVLPSWPSLQAAGYDWTSGKWQSVKAWLEAARLVKSENTGTFLVGRYACLADLRVALEDRKISLRPHAPLPTAGD